MELTQLKLSIRTINQLQKQGVWYVQDIIDRMKADPSGITLALAKIKYEDFVLITKALRKDKN